MKIPSTTITVPITLKEDIKLLVRHKTIEVGRTITQIEYLYDLIAKEKKAAKL